MVTCPYGPTGAMATRECLSVGPPQWGMVDDSNCSTAGSVLHSLTQVSYSLVVSSTILYTEYLQVTLTLDNIGIVAATLATLQYNHLSQTDIANFIQTTAAVLNSGLPLNETVSARTAWL